jgi:hypothetical protein
MADANKPKDYLADLPTRQVRRTQRDDATSSSDEAYETSTEVKAAPEPTPSVLESVAPTVAAVQAGAESALAVAGPAAVSAASEVNAAINEFEAQVEDTARDAAKQVSSTLNTWPLRFGALLLLVWLGGLGLMLYFLDSADDRWSRLLFILSSVQLIVFVAAGVVFGMAIQNQRSAESERRADVAEQRAAAFRTQADQYRQAATNGRVLAEVAKAQQALRNGRRGGSAADPATVAQSDAVGDLARRLFPD